jgi:SAM-dependent methyltransferase
VKTVWLVAGSEQKEMQVNTAAITPYNKAFYDRVSDRSLTSARTVVPLLLEMLPIKSVVDFGCGRGAWLKACLENGVETVLGLDGDYVDRDKLLIEPAKFRAVDLHQPIRLGQRFDMAVCLEVAEHLPARSARALVESLASVAPVVLFSAALPGQVGTSHINGQWPIYWEKLFAERGMRKYDVLRPMIWSDSSIEWWYRQNIYIYATSSHASLDSLEHFEPEFTLISNALMMETTLYWSPRASRLALRVRRICDWFSRAGRVR